VRRRGWRRCAAATQPSMSREAARFLATERAASSVIRSPALAVGHRKCAARRRS